MAPSNSDALLRLILRAGAVFYFRERSFTSPEPHFFIVLNRDPLTDEALVLVVSSSRVAEVQRRRAALPGTTVEISENEYDDFSKPSIVDCNQVLRKSRAEIAMMLDRKEAACKAQMSVELVQKLKSAVIASPLIDEETKRLIREPPLR